VDIEQIVTHRRRMFEDMGAEDKDRLSAMEASFRPWLIDHMRREVYHSWFACNAEGKAVAGADVWLIDWPPGQFDISLYRGYILNVYTHPDYRRQGLAKQLVQTCRDWCYDHDVKIVSLHASDEGRKVYEGLGFTPTNEMRTWKGRYD
jgi:GNAT superfamily N-acetyltransferase